MYIGGVRVPIYIILCICMVGHGKKIISDTKDDDESDSKSLTFFYNGTVSPLANLSSMIFRNYDSGVRPYCTGEQEIVDLSVDLAVRQLIDLDEPNQIVTMNVWMRLSIIRNMNSLSLIVLFHVLTGIHGKESVRNQHNLTAKDKGDKILTEKANSHNCDYDKGSVTDDVETSTSWKENGRQKDKKHKRKKGKEKLFKLGAIVGISIKEKRRKQHTIQMSIDQRLAIEKYESGSFSTNRGGFNVLSANIPLVADEAQGEYFVPDPSITKYEDFSNRKLPEIKKCSGADGDDDVYYEIDEDKMKSSTDMEGVYQNEIKEVTDKGSNDSDQTGYEIPLGSMKKKREQLTKQQSIDQRSDIASLENNPFSTNNKANTILFANESLNTDEAQGDYFVLDPAITKYNKDLSSLVLPETKMFSVEHGDERVYNEIDDDEIQPPRDIEGVHQKKIEEAMDKCSYNGDQNTYETPVSKKNKREQLKRPHSVDQGTEISHLENCPSSTNKGGNAIISANESLNTDEAEGEYFVLDPSVTKYNKDLSSLVLPIVKRFSVSNGDESVYTEIDEDDDERVYNENDEDEIQPPTDMEVVHQRKIEEAKDKFSYNDLRKIRQNNVQDHSLLTKKLGFHILKIVHPVQTKGDNAIPTANEFLNTDEAEGEYFVLDPSVTKYNKDLSNLVLPIIKRLSVSKGDEIVYTEIDEDKIESSTDMKIGGSPDANSRN
ncbi:unnamed protein product [Mytilus edulis]|uniref:Neurotransmitter-gated ion-channel ligand-binding domain-containing protein n=1 Tax=Mytilus edulis TaxID=6550 RepID=A0A8S3R2E0_MYTED|nr:unnamed protein product [Mytilus edulis]